MNQIQNFIKTRNLILVVILSLFLTIVYALITFQKKAPFAVKESSENSSEFKEFIMQNPEVILESINAHYKEKMRSEEELARAMITEKFADIKADQYTPIIKGKNSDITIYAFYDYVCGYCKTSSASVLNVLKEDGKIDLVIKQFPILGENSETAAKASIAVFLTAPESFLKFHKMLMAAKSTNINTVKDILTKLSIDVDKTLHNMQKKIVSDHIVRVKRIAADLRIQGTPAYIIDGKLYSGALDAEFLKKTINEIRARKLSK